MILRKPRKRPLSRAPDVYKKRHSSSPSHFSTARSTKTHYQNNNGTRPIPLDKNSIPERIRDIDQQMKELYIIDTANDEFSSSLKSSLLSVSNTKQPNSTGETFFTFWNSYVQSITAYLRQPTVTRCLNYVKYYFNKTKEIIKLLFMHQNLVQLSSSDNQAQVKIEKNRTEINNSLSSLQQLIDDASNVLNDNNSLDDINLELSNQIIGKLSNMTYPFDCFYHEIKSKYTFFFETVIPEKVSREPQLNDLSKSIKNIVDCTFSASKLDDLKKRFIQNLNDSTDIFNQIFKRASIRNLSNTEKMTHKHKSISYFTQESTSTKEISQNRNKTDVYFRENDKSTPRRHINSQKHRTQSDESSSGIDNMVTIDDPSESITDDIKIPPKPQINRVMMTLSKSKYDHLNRKFNNENSQSQQHNQQQQQQHSKSPNKPQNPTNPTNNNNNNGANSQVSLLAKKNSKRASSTISPGAPSSYPSRSRTNSIINHNNKSTNNSKKSNAVASKNSSSSNNSMNMMSQIYMNRGKEAQLLAQIEQISQQNDQLRQKRDHLAEMLARSKQDSKIDSLNREIKVLQDSLTQMETENSGQNASDSLRSQQLEFELTGEVQTLRELVDSIKETNGLISDEIEPCQQINNGLLSPLDLDDTTVTFDNLRLKKVCEEMKEKLRKRMARLDEIRRQNKKSLMISEIMDGQQLSNDEKIAVFNFVIMDSKLAKRENERLEAQLAHYQEQISSNNSINGELKFPVPISFSKDYNAPIRKLFSRINQLEEKVLTLKKSRNGVYNILIDQLFKIKNASIEVKRLDKEISQKIDKYMQIEETVQLKRKVFDNYEVLKEKSRELKIKYSTLKNSITSRMTTSQRYNIELQMDDIQDLFTCVMMEIERIGNHMISSQESLKDVRKGRSRIRREIKKYMDQECQVAVDSLNAEKRVSGLEAEASNLIGKENNLNKEDSFVSKIAESLAESAQTKEIINLINEQAKEFNLELEPNQAITERQRIEDLKDTVQKLINNGGPKMHQKLRIYNLRKEIESYH